MASKESKNKNSRVDSSANSDYSQKTNCMESDRQKFYKVYKWIESLTRQVSKFQMSLKKSDQKVEELKTENEKFKQALNINTSEIDQLQQYFRIENLQIYEILEPKSRKDDGEKAVIKLAEKLDIKWKVMIFNEPTIWVENDYLEQNLAPFLPGMSNSNIETTFVFKIYAKKLLQ